MSYSGYTQAICEKGHLNNVDFTWEDYVCWCTSKIIFENIVDDTNGDEFGYIDFDEFLLAPEEKKICCLGEEHIIKHATYRIPTKEEVLDKRTYLYTETDDLNIQVRLFCNETYFK